MSGHGEQEEGGHDDSGGHGEEAHEEGYGYDEDQGDRHDERSNEEHSDDQRHGDAGHKEHAHVEKHEEKPAGDSVQNVHGRKKSITESEVFILLGLAVLGRVLLKVTPLVNIPSVEPIIPIAVFAGLAYGTEAGIIVGLLAYPISNIFLPSEFFGMWILWQAVGGAVAGGLAGLARKATFNNLLWYTVLGTVLFELAVNLPDQLLLVWPFSFIHIASNFFFASLIGMFVLKEK